MVSRTTARARRDDPSLGSMLSVASRKGFTTFSYAGPLHATTSASGRSGPGNNSRSSGNWAPTIASTRCVPKRMLLAISGLISWGMRGKKQRRQVIHYATTDRTDSRR